MRVLLSLWFLLSGILLTGCKKDKDSAFIYHPPVTNFTIAEVVGDTLSLTDTALTYNNIQLNPSARFDSIKWNINNGAVLKTQDKLILRFTTEGIYNIKMTTYRYQYPSPGLITDSITKKIFIISREGGASYLSSFRGSMKGNENDSFNISIYRILQNYPAYVYNTHVLDNLPKGCRSLLPPNQLTILTTLSFGYKMFETDAARCFPATKCIGTYSAGKLVVDYSVIDSSQPFNPVTGTYTMIPKRFIGYRL